MQLPPMRHDSLPPLSDDAWQALRRRRDGDQRPASGKMARYVGVQHDLKALLQSAHTAMIEAFDIGSDDPAPLAEEVKLSIARVRAFDVPVLTGTSVACNQLHDF